MNDEKKPQRKKNTSDYEVGYGKPPKQTRFQKGRSGNPKGRPKGTKNLKTDLVEELGETVLVREGDQSRRVSKQRAVVKTLVTRTLKGDTRAASLLMSMMWRLMDTGEGIPDVEDALHDDELDILETFRARARRDAGVSEPGNNPPAPGGEDAP